MSISFASDIVILFTPKDVACMKPRNVDLTDYTFMSSAEGDVKYANFANARHVLARLVGSETPRMPKGGPFWSDTQLERLKNWIEEGCSP
jgi:hypothetical protein